MKVEKGKEYNYVEISSVNVSTGDIKPSLLKVNELPANAKIKLRLNELLVSKVRTYRKGIALIKRNYPNLIGSSAFVVLREKVEKKLNIEALFIFLRTSIFSKWSYKYYTGTSYPTLTDDDILNLPIPLLDESIQFEVSGDESIQFEVSGLIQKSFKSRENSKKLLEIAKRAVEIYIEKDETEGQKYINEQLQKMNGI